MANSAHINALRDGIMEMLRDEFNGGPSLRHQLQVHKTTAKYTDSNTVEVALFAEGNSRPAVFTLKVSPRRPPKLKRGLSPKPKRPSPRLVSESPA